MKRLLHYVKPYKSKFIISVLATILLAGLTPLRPYLIQYTIDNHILKFDYNGLMIPAQL